jgi:multiple sugar transport system permease protein
MATTVRGVRPLRRRWLSTQAARRTLLGYLFISPFILGFLLFFIVPALTAAWLTLYDWNMILKPVFIGLGNFRKVIKDPLFYQSLKVTAAYAFLSVPLSLVFSFLIALLMNVRVRGIAVFRTIYYIPSIVPSVANAVLWSFVLSTEFGLLNAFLNLLGLPKVMWLQDPRCALPALILMSMWGLGGSMVIYLAGLQGIPEVLYEAAEIDGAGRWGKMRHVTIPLISPVIFFNLVMGIIGSFQAFTAGFLMTAGGPQNATLFYVLYTYRNGMQYFDMGYASLLAWILFFIIMGMTLLVFKYVGSYVFYGDTGY